MNLELYNIVDVVVLITRCRRRRRRHRAALIALADIREPRNKMTTLRNQRKNVVSTSSPCNITREERSSKRKKQRSMSSPSNRFNVQSTDL